MILDKPGAGTTRPSSPSATCEGAQPTVTSNTQTVLNLYSDSSCCSQVENIKMGNLNECHNVNGGVPTSFWQANGQMQFGQSPPIHIFFYSEAGCQGTAFQTKLTNEAMCQSLGPSGWASFQISATGTGSGSSGATGALCPDFLPEPASAAANLVSLDLYSGSCCSGSVVESAHVGVGTCHRANAPFKGLTQNVGSSLFGQTPCIHIWAFDD